eukprot:9073328-Pyramimonas_sp.AAC.1
MYNIHNTNPLLEPPVTLCLPKDAPGHPPGQGDRQPLLPEGREGPTRPGGEAMLARHSKERDTEWSVGAAQAPEPESAKRLCIRFVGFRSAGRFGGRWSPVYTIALLPSPSMGPSVMEMFRPVAYC